MNIFKKTYQTDHSDNELIRQILEGKKTALTILVGKHQPFIYNLAWKLTGNISDAKDLTQETGNSFGLDFQYCGFCRFSNCLSTVFRIKTL
jgi:hypothetical protein